jgi:hypothetical protein
MLDLHTQDLTETTAVLGRSFGSTDNLVFPEADTMVCFENLMQEHKA